MIAQLSSKWQTLTLILIVIGFAIQQITVGHNLDTTTALTMFYTGLAGGVGVTAHAAGVNAAGNGQPQAPVAPPNAG